MRTTLRDVSERDLARVHVLNRAAVPHVNDVGVETLAWFAAHADRFRVAVAGPRVEAFLTAFGPGSSYESANYRWFHERFERFVYVDRVAVDAGARGLGLGTVLYRDVEDFARERAELLVCEVNVRPSNEASTAFHARAGFVTIGTQDTEGGTKTVALMAKPLDAEGERAIEAVRA